MPGQSAKIDSAKSPFSPNSPNLNIEGKMSDKTKSPGSSSMMAAWLSKSANKNDAAKPATKKEDTTTKTLKKDENSAPSKKSISTKLSEAFSDTDDIIEDKVQKKNTTKKSTEPAVKKTAKKEPSPKRESKPLKSKAKPAEKASPKIKNKVDYEENAAAKAKEKKPGNKFYAAYMRRDGPKNPGSKPIPIGKPDCFSGLKFLMTGVLDSMDRDECKKIVEKYGGSCISGVTKKLNYLITGDDAGMSKIEKAKELNIKMVTEDEFLQLICEKSGIKNPTYESTEVDMVPSSDEEIMELDEKIEFLDKKPDVKKLPELSESIDFLDNKKQKAEISEAIDFLDNKKSPKKIKKETKSPIKPKTELKSPVKPKPIETKQETKPVGPPKELSDNVSQLWVDKYKPAKMSKIIGQTTDKSNAVKLFNWLKNWQKNHGTDSKSVKKSWNDQDQGTNFKCALLSGPPGIGKTTTATLVSKEAGYSYIEFNASDSRSKKLLDKVIGESVESCSIDSYFKGKHKVKDVNSDKHLVIMDEVDGMAGNEDRGGILELINTIKHSKIPIICICNDRQHVKIRSLANHCFDLRFYKPRIEQVRGALMSVCFKEGIKITPELLDQIIKGCNYDIRQCLHNLSMWSSNNKSMQASESSKNDIAKAMKDTKMNPFEALKQIFTGDPNKSRNMNEKMEYFFTDYSLIPLLVQENYLSVRPTDLKGNTKSKRDMNHLQLLADSADSICMSDRVSRLIRSNNNWSLLPTQAVFATVIPGEKLHGSIGLPAFPGWFGKNSKQGRVDRILQELQKHMRMHISANKIGVGLDYLSVLKNMLSKPLIRHGADGIDQVIKVMNEYSLTRDDFDTILELSTWPGSKDPMSMIDSKVKAAFTRTYNKQATMNPFTTVDIKKLKAIKTTDDNPENGDDAPSSDDEKDEDITKDSMIKVKTKSKAAAAKTSKAKATKTTAVKRTAGASAGTPNKKKKT